MTAGITFWCDVSSQWGTCPQRATYATTDLAVARASAVRDGWRLSEPGDRCALYHAPRKGLSLKPRRLR